jgi:DNA polymerase-3 subunit delta
LAWLVTGDNPALIAEEVSRLIKQLLGDNDRSLALDDFTPEDDSEDFVQTVVDACHTPPFLADRRVVVLREAGKFTSDQLQPMIAYLQEPLASTRLVVVSGGGTLPPKATNAFKSSPAATVISTKVDTKDVRAWLDQRLAHAPVRLSAPAVVLIEQHLGEDLSRLNMLLSVLETAYGSAAPITPEQLKPYLGQAGSVPPWDLTDAIDQGKTQQALSVLHRMMGPGDRHPLVILSILQRHFGNMLRVQSPGINNDTKAAAALGIASGRSTFPAHKALQAARRLGQKRVGDITVLLADAELDIKGKTGLDSELVTEILVARLCRISAAS